MPHQKFDFWWSSRLNSWLTMLYSFLKNIGYYFVFFLKSNIVLGFVLPAQGGKNIVSGIVLPTKEDKNIVWDIVCSIEILGENIGYCFKFFMLLKYCFGFVMGFQKSKEYCIWYCIVILRYWVENIGYWVYFVWSSNIVLGIVLPSKWGYCRTLVLTDHPKAPEH